MRGGIALLTWLAVCCGCPTGRAQPSIRVGPLAPWNQSGGATTVSQSGQNAFSLPVANAALQDRRHHVVGNSFFNRQWVASPASPSSRDGLGPHFLARSCSACHRRDGRGVIPDKGVNPVALVTRISVRMQADSSWKFRPDPFYGAQITTRAVPGHRSEAEIRWRIQTKSWDFPDGTQQTLKWRLFVVVPTSGNPPVAPSTVTSFRNAPPVFGLGLLQAIPEAAIRAQADPDDENGDGISGRVNEVWDDEQQSLALGRFGWKANQPNLRQQTARAFLDDMGLTSQLYSSEPITPQQAAQNPAWHASPEPEVESEILDRVERYLQTLAPPAHRFPSEAAFLQGKALFSQLGCAACHTPTWRTGHDTMSPALAAQEIHPYTDLLLHDMGEALADGRPDGLASGAEWRTPPLWGIGLTRAVSGGESYLHDGRAGSLEAAILWHGGEGAPARDAYQTLEASERRRLIQFLESL